MIDQSTSIQWAKDAGFYIHHNPNDVWLIRGSANNLQALINRAIKTTHPGDIQQLGGDQ